MRSWCQGVAIAGHGHGTRELRHAGALEGVEGWIEQGGEEFANTVGAEVERQDGIAVAHAVVAADAGGDDELVGHAFAIGLIHGAGGVGEGCALAVGDGEVGAFHPVPAIVAVHCVVAADDGADSRAWWQCLLQALQVLGAGLRGGVATVGEGVDAGGNAGVGQDAGERQGMVLVGVDATGGDEAHQMAGTAVGLQASDHGGEGRVAGQAAVDDGLADSRQFLHDDPAGADVEVPDLGIAHLAFGQADIEARCAQEGVRPAHQQVECRGVGLADGIVMLVFAPSPAVEDDEHDGTGRRGGHAAFSLCGGNV
jgi:hypothetical protein